MDIQNSTALFDTARDIQAQALNSYAEMREETQKPDSLDWWRGLMNGEYNGFNLSARWILRDLAQANQMPVQLIDGIRYGPPFSDNITWDSPNTEVQS